MVKHLKFFVRTNTVERWIEKNGEKVIADTQKLLNVFCTNEREPHYTISYNNEKSLEV